MALSSAVAQEGVSRVSSYISTKFDDRASRARLVARLDEARYQLKLALELTAMLPITCVLLLERRKKIVQDYIECTQLLNKHNPEEAGQVLVVRSSSYLERIFSAATASLSSAASSPFGFFNKEHCLSSSDVQEIEWRAKRAKE